MSTSKKLGRPPDTSSEETRGRILEAARVCFSRYGFDRTTNRQLAEAAALTTGAIYHYFGSKRELYVEAHDQVQAIVYERFEQAVEAAEPTFADRITAVLDEALALQREDPSLATFLAAVRTDISRHEELRDEPRLRPNRRLSFFGALIELGVDNGEIRLEDAEVVSDVVAATMMGLVSASGGEPGAHARAVEGMKRLVDGSLIQPAAPTVRPTRRPRPE